MKKWIALAVSLIGIIALCALVWFVFPIIGFGEARPFESVWLRLALILFILAVYCAYYAYRFYRRHKAAQAIESALTAQESAEPDSDAPVLAERMNDALLTLKKSHKARGDFLYELPWYVIIGPPGAGKTTALLNSGLKFPLAATSKGPVAGVGGTRYCDWWFTEEAVLIDTAGRYTTQDSDAAADRRSWLSFLELLKTNRPKQPINGVLIAISIEDLMTLGPDELAAHASAIKKRLMELYDKLQVNFPVYALFTKADLVSGFMEYFGSFGEQRRRLVWGATFRTTDKTENKIREVEPEFDLLIERLSEELPDRLQEEADPLSRAKLFGFPSQIAALKPVVIDFLNQIFEPTRYHTSIALRGFYFTSGTQQGTPIDKVLGAMSGSLRLQNIAAPAYSGRAKSFFLGDLLTKVIFGEAGWVSSNRQAVRRARIIQYGAYSLLGLACIAVLGAWWMSYFANTRLMTDADLEIEEYKRIAQPIVQQNPVSDTDFAKTLDMLHKLRYMPAGYGFADQPTPLLATFGLSQRERLQSAAQAAYRTALDRVFRSRLILFLEKEIEANANDPSYIYDALKVYLMLGGDPNIPVDDGLIVDWMASDWETSLYPGAANQKTREELLKHLQAMLDLGEGSTPGIALNGALVAQAQNILVRMSVADRAYALIKSKARGAPVEDWIASSRAGDDAKVVFETKDGKDLDTVRVPNLYTYQGFQTLFIGQLDTIADQLDKERWVLGKAGQQTAVEKQYKTLWPDLQEIYRKEFKAAWDSALGRLKLKPFAADKPIYTALQAAAGPASPIKEMIQSIAAETKLTEEREEEKPAQGNAGGAVGKAVEQKLASKLTGLSRIGFDIARKSQQRAGGSNVEQAPGANVEAEFKRFQQLAEGKDGQRPIDTLVHNLDGVYRALTLAQGNPDGSGSTEGVQQQLGNLRINASRLPPPFSAMLLEKVEEFENDVTSATISDLTTQLNNEVTQKCEQIIANRYPFADDSSREVPWQEFANLFAPNGVFDKFFNEKLANLADLSRGDWTWRKNTRLSRELSQPTLRQFQNAAAIRDAFFPAGGQIPNINLTITPLTLSRDASGAEFEINGAKLKSVHEIDTPQDFSWPGTSADGTASITILPEVEGLDTSKKARGPWALYRLLNDGSLTQSGDRLSVRYVIAGKEVSYQIKVGTLENPFALPALRSFSCPAGL